MMNIATVFASVLNRPLTREIQLCGPIQARVNLNAAWDEALWKLMLADDDFTRWSIKHTIPGVLAEFVLRDEYGNRLVVSCSCQCPVTCMWHLGVVVLPARVDGAHFQSAWFQTDILPNGAIPLDAVEAEAGDEPHRKLARLWRCGMFAYNFRRLPVV